MKKIVKLSNVAYKMDDEIKEGIKELGIDIDNCEILRKSWGTNDPINKSELDIENRTCIRYVSTRDVDDSGDIIVPKGVDFSLFLKRGSPIFFNHDYAMPQIAKAEWIKKDDKGIKVKQRYAVSEDKSALCNYLWELVQQGMNTQSSVGIIPTEVIKIGDPDFKKALKVLSSEWPELRKEAKGCKRIITKCYLFEHSDVGLGCQANTSIVSKARKILIDVGADEKLLKQLGLPMPIIEENNEVDDLDIEKKIADPVDPFDDKEGEEEVVEVVEVPEVVEPEVPEVSKVTMVKEPRVVKLIQKPQYSIDENDIKDIIGKEIRRKMGRLL